MRVAAAGGGVPGLPGALPPPPPRPRQLPLAPAAALPLRHPRHLLDRAALHLRAWGHHGHAAGAGEGAGADVSPQGGLLARAALPGGGPGDPAADAPRGAARSRHHRALPAAGPHGETG